MGRSFHKKEYASPREKRRARRRFLFRLRQRVIECLIVAVLIVAVALPISLHNRKQASTSPSESTESIVSNPTSSSVTQEESITYPLYTADTVKMDESVDADFAVLVDVTENRIVATKKAAVRVYPASVTKVMTLLVAVENITDFTDTFTMTYAITDPLYVANATVAGFLNDEEIPIEDLLYGTILPSGADACQALAEHVAGSEEGFVKLMNERVAKLGLNNTHFVNTSGLHDDNHYTTAEDMAVIMQAAMANEHCRQVLSTYQYTTAKTPQHPEGILLTSTMFSRMYGTEPDGATVIAGKTGYTTEAGHTMVSYAEGEDGHDYILVTLKGSNRWKATYDAIDVYTKYCPSVKNDKDDTKTTSAVG